MAQSRLAYRTVGMLWIALGSIVLLISIGLMLAAAIVMQFFNAQLPDLASLFAPSLSVLPSVQQLLGILLGVFCVIIGAGLFGLQSWARTVGVAFNITMGICAAIITVALFVSLPQRGDSSSLLGVLLLLIGGSLAVFLVVIGYQLSTPSAMDAFFGSLPKMPPIAPVTCPTCNGALNINTGTCANCDREPDLELVQRAKLVSLESGQEYHIGTKRATRIGRDTPGFEIQLDDPTVSREHATIEYVDGHFHLHALRATNGTYVNDMTRSVIDTEIKNGDLIAFAQSQFRFIVQE